jgi:hypothetical protein
MLLRERRAVESRLQCTRLPFNQTSNNPFLDEDCRGRLRRIKSFRYELRLDKMSTRPVTVAERSKA